MSSDEPPRPQTTLEGLAKLAPSFTKGMNLPAAASATVTAGNASTLADGAAALLLCRGDAAKELGRFPSDLPFPENELIFLYHF